MSLNETHDPALESWVESANAPDTDFPIQNLPFCVFRQNGATRAGVGIGDQILELPGHSSLASVMALPRGELRLELSRSLRAGNPNPPRDRLHPIADCTLLMPAEVGDFTDFFASIYHATNVGKKTKPDRPLPPNYKYLPIAYHGRASSVVVSGTPVHRPNGQWREGKDEPAFGPSRKLDYECELGCFIGRANALGQPVPIDQAEEHMFGLCLLNDWSARDIQYWEAQLLGPFLSKSFMTTISPWIVTMEALEPFRVPRTGPAPFPYLDGEVGAYAITLEVWRSNVRVSSIRFEYHYWTFAQMLAHHTSNGCNLRPGDLLGSGTVSGPDDDAHGCLLELPEPVAYLEDGDEVTLRGYAEREGARRIGFGECSGRLVYLPTAPFGRGSASGVVR